MGRLTAEGFAQAVAEGQIDLDLALDYHMSVNHFPAIDRAMIPACKEAIALAAEGNFYLAVQLPEGVFFRGQDNAPARVIIEAFHLESFIVWDDDE